MTKRTKDKIRGAQCPDCGRMMEKVERWDDVLMIIEILWRCTNKECNRKV
jgi:peptide subunit release factor 1 (eRF1)